MKLITPPRKPFTTYKWRWAAYTPTENLNEPTVFLGVLRVFNKFKNYEPGSKEILEGLQIVQGETHTTVNLVRTHDRNLVRNSGQYWKALGLLDEAHGRIHVSPFGELLADGKITQVEFATTVVKTLELPNAHIENTTAWNKHSLTIKPLELILDILSFIFTRFGESEAFITPFELRKIVIPLAGVSATTNTHSEAVIQYRRGLLDISKFPDCAPESNDKRMAREFLIFLNNYGFCNRVTLDKGNDNERYFLGSISKEEISELHKLVVFKGDLVEIVKQIKITQIPANVERKKVFREVTGRPYQKIFRDNTLIRYEHTCVITGVNIDSVLEAAHIIPVAENGSDQMDNSLCLRSDIHQLFDSGHLRLFSTGHIKLSDLAGTNENYGLIPKQVKIPDFINKDNLDWRIKYL